MTLWMCSFRFYFPHNQALHLRERQFAVCEVLSFRLGQPGISSTCSSSTHWRRERQSKMMETRAAITNLLLESNEFPKFPCVCKGIPVRWPDSNTSSFYADHNGPMESSRRSRLLSSEHVSKTQSLEQKYTRILPATSEDRGSDLRLPSLPFLGLPTTFTRRGLLCVSIRTNLP